MEKGKIGICEIAYLHTIQAVAQVAYSDGGNSQSTGRILLGTHCGCVYQSQLTIRGPDLEPSLLLNLDSNLSLSGLHFGYICVNAHDQPSAFILLSTRQPVCRLYYTLYHITSVSEAHTLL